jgi:hypothetical protein
MRRKLFNIAAVLSLVAGVVMLLLFASGRSWFGQRTPGRQHLAGSWYYRIFDSRSAGCLGLIVYHDWPTPDVGPPLAADLSYTPQALAWYDRQPTGRHMREFGFGYDHDTYFEGNATRSMIAMGRLVLVGIPFWAAWVLWLMPIPFAVVIQRRVVVSGRLKRGRCAICGYDLRATPDRCPECGTVPKPPHDPPMQRTEAGG